jgi:group I intron endonuclease
MKTGIYKILNKINNKVYIGSTTTIEKRWRDHKWHLNHNKHHNLHLQSSWNKYGAESFEFTILLECRIDDLLSHELSFILAHNSFDNSFGYNVNDPEHTFLDRKHSEKTKQKLSFKKLGEKNPMYGRTGNKHPRYGMTTSLKTKDKISSAKMGIPTHRQTNLKLNLLEVIEIRRIYAEGKLTQEKIGNMFNVSYGAINKIITRKTWSHVA